MPEPILVSACLLGLHTRYDGAAREHPGVLAWLRDHDLLPVPVCPEQLGGLPTPRPPCRFVQGDGRTLLDGEGRLQSEDGRDLAPAFLLGARETLRAARACGCRRALLKERSPSCGSRFVYRGETLVPGQGVAAALLLRNAIAVCSEEEL